MSEKKIGILISGRGSNMMSIMTDEAAKHLCARLVQEELKHKLRLEVFYDDLFYGY